jgi:hypothetical protein
MIAGGIAALSGPAADWRMRRRPDRGFLSARFAPSI